MSQLLEDIYRQESSQILAALIRIFGVENVALAEDTAPLQSFKFQAI
ncbi:hypothetical protein [Enterovibrio nigricans]|nr:hypothetical protein [Enterovibrio nigricans]